MQKRKIISLIFTAVFLLSMINGCAYFRPAQHEVLTFEAPFRNSSAFIDLLHSKYPEIKLAVIPYSGRNQTAYMTSQLRSGDMPDIFFTTTYNPGLDDLSDRLIDLSGYNFTSNYSEARLHDVTNNGAIYLLPVYFSCIGITYNKTLLEKHGWKLPTSFKELEELAPKVKEAGCNLALNQIGLPGFGFQYICNILDTDFLNTIEGRKWQRDYLSGKASLSGTPQMMNALKVLNKWRDIGMLNGNGDPADDGKTKEIMAEGNTLFMLGSDNTFTSEETADKFSLMPYLSDDGTRNTYILNISRYVGLNKHLKDPGNKQKLADAIHVMEVLSTKEGLSALNDNYSNTSMLPLKDFSPENGSYYSGIEDELDKGATAPFLYAGWENVILPVGEAGLSFIKGKSDTGVIAEAFDSSQKQIQNNTHENYTTVTEKIDTEDCARLVGICFGKASGADMALVSVNKWYKTDEDSYLNSDGVSGALFPLPVTDQEITSILPTGWRGNIQTVTLTGKKIKELIKKGYIRNGDKAHPYPYINSKPEGMEIDDNKIYKVAICGSSNETSAEGNLTDTGILGLEAARDYFSQFKTFSKSDIIWR